jgi:hypothetical protein
MLGIHRMNGNPQIIHAFYRQPSVLIWLTLAAGCRTLLLLMGHWLLTS